MSVSNDPRSVMSPELQSLLAGSRVGQQLLGMPPKKDEKPTEIEFQIKLVDGEVLLAFSKLVTWVAFDPDTAIEVGRRLIAQARLMKPRRKR